MEQPSGTLAPRRRPSFFDKFARSVALVALVIILTVVYWIPLGLIPSPFSAPLVFAILTLSLVNLASRMHRLRQRVDALEARRPSDQK